jgi:hypothetical protein
MVGVLCASSGWSTLAGRFAMGAHVPLMLVRLGVRGSTGDDAVTDDACEKMQEQKSPGFQDGATQIVVNHALLRHIPGLHYTTQFLPSENGSSPTPLQALCFKNQVLFVPSFKSKSPYSVKHKPGPR